MKKLMLICIMLMAPQFIFANNINYYLFNCLTFHNTYTLRLHYAPHSLDIDSYQLLGKNNSWLPASIKVNPWIGGDLAQISFSNNDGAVFEINYVKSTCVYTDPKDGKQYKGKLSTDNQN